MNSSSIFCFWHLNKKSLLNFHILLFFVKQQSSTAAKNPNSVFLTATQKNFVKLVHVVVTRSNLTNFWREIITSRLNMKGVIASYIKGFFFYQLITKKAQ